MQVKTIGVTVKRTIQTDSYESSSVELSATAELEEDDDEEESLKELYATVTKQTKKAIDNEFRKYVNSKKEREREKKDR